MNSADAKAIVDAIDRASTFLGFGLVIVSIILMIGVVALVVLISRTEGQ